MIRTIFGSPVPMSEEESVAREHYRFAVHYLNTWPYVHCKPYVYDYIKEAAEYDYRDAVVIGRCLDMIESYSKAKYNPHHKPREWSFDREDHKYYGDCDAFIKEAVAYYNDGISKSDSTFYHYRTDRETYYYNYYAPPKIIVPEDDGHNRKKSTKSVYSYYSYDSSPFNDPSDYDDMDDYLDDAWGYDFEDWDDALDYWENY